MTRILEPKLEKTAYPGALASSAFVSGFRGRPGHGEEHVSSVDQPLLLAFLPLAQAVRQLEEPLALRGGGELERRGQADRRLDGSRGLERVVAVPERELTDQAADHDGCCAAAQVSQKRPALAARVRHARFV